MIPNVGDVYLAGLLFTFASCGRQESGMVYIKLIYWYWIRNNHGNYAYLTSIGFI